MQQASLPWRYPRPLGADEPDDAVYRTPAELVLLLRTAADWIERSGLLVEEVAGGWDREGAYLTLVTERGEVFVDLLDTYPGQDGGED